MHGQRQHREVQFHEPHHRVVVPRRPLEAGHLQGGRVDEEVAPEATQHDIARVAAAEHDDRVRKQAADHRQLDAVQRGHVDEHLAVDVGDLRADAPPVGFALLRSQRGIELRESLERRLVAQEFTVGVLERRSSLERTHFGLAREYLPDQRVP